MVASGSVLQGGGGQLYLPEGGVGNAVKDPEGKCGGSVEGGVEGKWVRWGGELDLAESGVSNAVEDPEGSVEEGEWWEVWRGSG